MSLHLHCPYCGELLDEDRLVVTTSAREGTRQETYDLACRCGTRLRLQLPPERWTPARRRRRGRGRPRSRPELRRAPRGTKAPAGEEPSLPRPSADHPFPFTPWQYARLLILRSRVREGEVNEG
ncbi:MAG TPA: hypothetical protein VFB73_07415 [Chloroflexota bacterium]|nr:hypothetical protein [Chloroflexota bacterium]